MKLRKSKMFIWMLLIMMVITCIPSNAFALPGDLLDSRSMNEVKHATYMKFYEAWSNGKGQQIYYPAFDRASGRALFCMDPGVTASENSDHTKFKDYTVTIANGKDDVNAMINKVKSETKLRKVAGKAEVIDTTKLDSIMYVMSTLHYYSQTNPSRFGSPTDGTAYNKAAIAAAQGYIWDCIEGTSGMKKITNAKGNDKTLISEAKKWYPEILQEAANLYTSNVAEFGVKYTKEGGEPEGMHHYTKPTQEEAEAKPISLKAMGEDLDKYTFKRMSGSDEAASQKNFGMIKFVRINGGEIKNFENATDKATCGNFTITRTADGFEVKLANKEDNEVYTVEFLKTNEKPEGSTTASGAYDEEWAIYAKGPNGAQSFFTAYKKPVQGQLFISFQYKPNDEINEDTEPPKPVFPGFEFFQHKYDLMPGYDGDNRNTTTPINSEATCTPVGDTKLDATFTLDYSTDLGASGTVSSQADLYGHGASEVIYPWGTDTVPASSVVNEKETWSTYKVDEDTTIEYISRYDWDGTTTVTIKETEAPEGHHDSDDSYTHTIKYHGETQRSSPFEEFSPIAYTITVDGQDTGLTEEEGIMATWDSPLASPTGEDDFINEHWDGVLQIIKEKDSDDIFSEEHGQGTVAGGVVGGKEYSTKSEWTIRLVDKSIYTSKSPEEAAELFSGYEESPYIKVKEDSAMQSTPVGDLMHCYKVMLDGSGTPADERNPLTPSKFGQIYVSGIPYGTYLVTETKADADRYVKESMYITISRDDQVISTDIINTAKENILKVVKVDSETGKTVPSDKTAFRIRYMGSPEYRDPTQTPNYGRYLPNASNLNASVTHPEDYIFYTDTAGEVKIPYALPYGSYQIEELLVPEGYYIGLYKEDGVANTVDGTANVYGPDKDNYQTTGTTSMNFNDRVAVYNSKGEKVDYTTDETIVFNYYNFDVTEQDDHVDGTDYNVYTLTVEMQNTAAKGKVQISKLGERLVGFKDKTDEYGNKISEPIYESFPLKDVVFGIYSAEDVLLEDGEEAPIAYDKMTNEEIKLVTDVLNHIQFPNAEIIQSGTHETSGAEVIYTKQRDTSENNISTVEYLTPVQKGTKYSVEFSRYDEENKLTYDYDLEFGLEYTAGGWNYTDIILHRTITADDYVPFITDELPHVFNGTEEVTYNTALFANKNKFELNGELVNEYNPDAEHYEIQSYSSNATPYVAEINDSTNLENILDMPEIPEGYVLQSILNDRITIENAYDVNDILVAVKVPYTETFPGTDLVDEKVRIEWKPVTTADTDSLFVPRYKIESVTNMPILDKEHIPALDNKRFEALYAENNHIYMKINDEIKMMYITAEDEILFFNPDGSDIQLNGPTDIPEGYECPTEVGRIMAIKTDETVDGADYKMYVLDTDTNTYRWIDCTQDGESYKQRVQDFSVTLTQHNTSKDGWHFEMDGIELNNFATNEDTATAIITLPYDVTPTITDSVGCDITTKDLAVGSETSIIVHHPTAPVYFNMIDGTHVEMVYLGGYTKTTLTVPAENELPKIFRNDVEIDYFDNAHGGLTPDKTHHEFNVDEYNYIRVTRHESNVEHLNTYYVIDIVNNATDLDDAFVVDYHGTYQSSSIVVPDAITGAQRGNLQFSSIYRTMRYPLSDLVEKITTDEKGIATSKLLPLGDYVIRELECPDDFVASNATYPFSLDYKNQFTPLIWASAEVDNGAVNVQLDITKGFQKALNSDTYEPKAGAVFGVYAYNTITASHLPSNSEDVTTSTIHKGDLVATVTVDENGKAVETIKLPIGDYYVQEITTLPEYEVNDTQFIFRVDDSQKSEMVKFSYEADGIYGKIMHTGYKTAEIEVTTYTQIPVLNMTVNDIVYDLSKALDAETVGNNVLVENVVDADRSTFRIIGSVDKPVTIKFDNRSKLVVDIDDSTYTAQFINGDTPAIVDDGHTGNITVTANDDGSKTYEYNPLVAFTGYTAESSTIYTAPQSKLTAANGTSLEFMYDLVEGVKKAVITYPQSYEYYANEDLPTKDAKYYYGDIDMNGEINAEDIALLNDYLNNGGALTSYQLTIADANKDKKTDNTDVTAIQELIDGTKTQETVTVKVPYLPSNAILFETEGFGNNAYVGTVVDKEKRTVTVDLSRLTEAKTVKVGNATATLNGDVISLDGGKITATNTETNKTIENGYQPDALTLSDGNTLTSANRTITLQSARNTASVTLDINYDHSFADVKVTHGTVTTAWVNGELKEAADAQTFRMAKGNAATIVFADNSIYHLELSNTGYIAMSVENILNGSLAYNSDANPTLLVNGSSDNFVDVDYKVIKQTVPMDETSIDEIRQYNVKNVTLARNDSFVKQLQVKINSAGNLVEDEITKEPTDDGTNNSQVIENDLRPYISKVNATTGKELPGAKIEIYDANGNVIVSGISDKNGKLFFDKPEPGTYTFKEISAPAGFKLNEEIFEFTVHPDGTITGDNTIKDYPKDTPDNPGGGPSDDRIYISKVDVTTSKGIPGAKIEVLSADKKIVIASGTTDERGRFYFRKPDNNAKYWFHEIVAPQGYVLNEEMFSFTIKDGLIKGDLTITNEKASISKVDATTAKGIPGAKIEIMDWRKNAIASGYSDENGKFYFDRPSEGVYWFHEVVAPEGYILNEEIFSFAVLENGAIRGDTTITNERAGVTISKVDITTSEGVPGATIEVMDKDGKIIASGVTDDKGFFGFDKPETPGTYWFHETVAPDGYILNEELFTFEILEDGTIIGDCTITNIPNTVVIQKEEIWTSRPIEGASIAMWDEEGKLIQVSMTDKDGKAYFAVPKVGTFVYREQIAPEGYILDEGTHTITLHQDGTITGEVRFTNTPYVPRTGVTDWTPILVLLACWAVSFSAGIAIAKHKMKNN